MFLLAKRLYLYEWTMEWTQWDNGEEGATYHKYPISNDVEIQKVEVQLNIK